jgi:hypothetical protein
MLFIQLFQFLMSWKKENFNHFVTFVLFWTADDFLYRLDFQISNSVLERRLKNQIRTTRDEKKLLTESTTNVLIETFDDSDDVSQNSESQVYNLLNNLLVSSRTNIKEQNDQMWDSVFWNDDNYRPDKTTQTMNDIYKKLDKEEKKHLNF